MSSNFSKTVNRTESQKSHVSALQWVAMLIVVLVVLFSDVMFIKLMWNHFPDGFMKVLAVGGAIATGLSIITLLIGKLIWFRPGAQMNWAYVFMFVEIGVSILNVLAACGVQGMDYWMMISPATPFVSLIGWTFIMVKDSSTKQRHEDMDMEDELLRSERAFIKMQHDARMEINYKALEYNKQYMIEALENPQHQRSIQLGADRSTANAIQQLTGRYVPHQIASTSSIVESDPPKRQVVEPALVAHKIQYVDPHKVKPEVDQERMSKPKSLGSVFSNVHAAVHEAMDNWIDGKEKPVEKSEEVQDDEFEDDEDLSEERSPSEWTLEEWQILRDKIDAFAFDDLWKLYKGDTPQPWDKSITRKKTKKSKALPDSQANQ
jgi:hypothetical protein